MNTNIDKMKHIYQKQQNYINKVFETVSNYINNTLYNFKNDNMLNSLNKNNSKHNINLHNHSKYFINGNFIFDRDKNESIIYKYYYILHFRTLIINKNIYQKQNINPYNFYLENIILKLIKFSVISNINLPKMWGKTEIKCINELDNVLLSSKSQIKKSMSNKSIFRGFFSLDKKQKPKAPPAPSDFLKTNTSSNYNHSEVQLRNNKLKKDVRPITVCITSYQQNNNKKFLAQNQPNVKRESLTFDLKKAWIKRNPIEEPNSLPAQNSTYSIKRQSLPASKPICPSIPQNKSDLLKLKQEIPKNPTKKFEIRSLLHQNIDNPILNISDSSKLSKHHDDKNIQSKDKFLSDGNSESNKYFEKVSLSNNEVFLENERKNSHSKRVENLSSNKNIIKEEMSYPKPAARTKLALTSKIINKKDNFTSQQINQGNLSFKVPFKENINPIPIPKPRTVYISKKEIQNLDQNGSFKNISQPKMSVIENSQPDKVIPPIPKPRTNIPYKNTNSITNIEKSKSTDKFIADRNISIRENNNLFDQKMKTVEKHLLKNNSDASTLFSNQKLCKSENMISNKNKSDHISSNKNLSLKRTRSSLFKSLFKKYENEINIKKEDTKSHFKSKSQEKINLNDLSIEEKSGKNKSEKFSSDVLKPLLEELNYDGYNIIYDIPLQSDDFIKYGLKEKANVIRSKSNDLSINDKRNSYHISKSNTNIYEKSKFSTGFF